MPKQSPSGGQGPREEYPTHPVNAQSSCVKPLGTFDYMDEHHTRPDKTGDGYGSPTAIKGKS